MQLHLKDIAKKPSAAVRAMIEGIKIALDDPQFCFNMETFGYVDGHICFGCVATATLCHLTNTKLDRSTFSSILEPPQMVDPGTFYRAKAYRVDIEEVENFENAINELRLGEFPHSLLHFYTVNIEVTNVLMEYFDDLELPPLTNKNVKNRHDEYLKLAELFENYGI